MNEPRYPLCWPAGQPRTPPIRRMRAKFVRTEWNRELGRRVTLGGLSVADALRRIGQELDHYGVSEDTVVVSTNNALRLDGMPRGDRGEPQDPGVAVYWTRKKQRQCMAIDRYDRVADNLAAAAATLEAMRAIERHGGSVILDRAFTGFAALPERAGGADWREILGFEHLTTPTESMVKEHFRERLAKAHTDTGGSRDEMERLIWARDAALRELNPERASATSS
jgi:hypothetical protein